MESAKVERPGTFVNLNGITTAQGNTRLDFPSKVGEIALEASAALRMARHADGLHAAGPDVAREQTPVVSLGVAREDFQSFGHFERGDQIDDRSENTDGVASLLEPLRGGAGFEETSKAGRCARTNGHGQAVTGDGSRVDPRAAGFHGDIVDQEASFEIIGAVEEQIDSIEQCIGVAGAEIGDDAFDGNGRIDRAQLTFCGDSFGEDVEGVGLVKEDLALQVRRLNEIAVDDFDIADAGANEKIGSGGSDSATANDGRP